jgi:hypothetical protein
MKIVILPSARDDLADGFNFYERQRDGLGDYFLESLSSDIDSLRLYAGIHLKRFVFTGYSPSDFPMRSITIQKTKRSASGRYSTVGKIRPQFTAA